MVRRKKEVCEIKLEGPVGQDGVDTGQGAEAWNQSPRQSQSQNHVVCASLLLSPFPLQQDPKCRVLCAGWEESLGYDVQ